MKKGLIFDLDGTLIDSLQDLASSTNRTLKKHNLKEHELEKYRYFVGNGMKKLIEQAIYPHTELLDICLEEFYKDYTEHALDKTYPYKGISELIEQLHSKGYQLAVVTNKPHDIAVKVVNHIFKDKFIAVYGNMEEYPKKPHPALVQKALKIMNLTKEECVYIGDSDVDIKTAKNANMESIGVVWGFRGEKELREQGATYIAHIPQDIMEIIQ